MRCIATAAACLLGAGLAAGECTVVEGIKFRPSWDRVRITALVNGKPQKNVKIDVFAASGVPRISLSAKDDGVAVLPQLPPGSYRVFAAAPNNMSAELFLDVTMSARGETSSFSMDLAAASDHLQATQKMLTTAAKKLPIEQIREFKGLVLDPAGARVSGAKIEVFQFGFLDKAPVVQIKTTQDGRFSGSLTDGKYLAIATTPGFRTELLVFKVARSESSQDLRISMQVGGC